MGKNSEMEMVSEAKHLHNGHLGEREENDEKTEKKKEKAAKEAMVGPFSLFRFADCWDIMMIFIGTVMAVANGAVLPLMCIVFGDMTDSLVSSASNLSNPSEYSLIYLYIFSYIFNSHLNLPFYIQLSLASASGDIT
ncbi:hypothetical protein ILYODFUR_027631 [Ilyodon furcidens]|uniref:Uncharacterized protein n=1 Tax=Ilyodon furcidens TaxID=33524 RepID=A0ABV0U2E9_9TELE